jgi:DNA-binding response OmpR family regulator
MSTDPTEADTGFILIVDDSPINLKVAGTILTSAGFRTHMLPQGNGVVAWAEESQPDLILMDIMMPGMDGIEVCRQLKANPKTAEIPVIFLTAKVETADLVSGFSAGGADYLTKPFKAEELIVRVRSHIKIRNLQRELLKKNATLQESLEQIAQLKNAMLVICAWTKEVKVDGEWITIEKYLSNYLGIQLTHGMSDTGAKLFTASTQEVLQGRQE